MTIQFCLYFILTLAAVVMALYFIIKVIGMIIFLFCCGFPTMDNIQSLQLEFE